MPALEWSTHLPLLEAFISESLRLYPPAPAVLSECHATEPIVVPTQPDIVVKGGDVIFYLVYAMSRLPAIWGSDAEVFRPERFMQPKAVVPENGHDTSVQTRREKHSDATARKSAWENPIFHAGPRSCPGKQMAKLEISS